MIPIRQYLDIALLRVPRILRKHILASDRILEQKIADAGPFNQRVEPHLITQARQLLMHEGAISSFEHTGTPWFHTPDMPPSALEERKHELLPLEARTTNSKFARRLGQALEIAVFRSLEQQSSIEFIGGFLDLDKHDDSTEYRKEEPPRILSGRRLEGDKRLDFLLHQPDGGWAGVEVKNMRQWLYPYYKQIQLFLVKCCVPQ